MLSKEDQQKSQEAIVFIKKNKQILYAKFADIMDCPPTDKPTTLFMAGSPGAGKTEFSRNFNIGISSRLGIKQWAIRIDLDDIKTIIPVYNNKNSDIVQSAACIGVEKLFDYGLHKKQNIILDGTFAKYELSCDNISRSLAKNREVGIIYMYQNPVLAWDFTKRREKIEGRSVPKDFFIKSLFAAKENVNKAKERFGDKITLFVIEKDYLHRVKKAKFNVVSIDNYIKIPYNYKSLNELLK